MATQPFLGEVRAFSFSFPPKGWALCNGALLGINQNQALYSILGTQYGGNGTTTFALPNLQGSVVTGSTTGNPGQVGGFLNVTLTSGQNAPHVHPAQGTTASATISAPGSTVMLGQLPGASAYSSSTANLTALASPSVSSVGGQPHTNLQPSTVLSACIALTGIYPSRN